MNDKEKRSFQRLPGMFFWYVCEGVEFDIRQVRRILGIEPEQNADWNYPLTVARRCQVMRQIQEQMGEREFSTIIEQAKATPDLRWASTVGTDDDGQEVPF
jgi:hypothetical protein